MSEAACRAAIERGEAQASDWFPDRHEYEALSRAVRICSTCPVTEQCLEAGLRERQGIWGGLSERQRSKLRAGVRHCATCKVELVDAPRQQRYCEPCARDAIEASKRAHRLRRMASRLDVSRGRVTGFTPSNSQVGGGKISA
jgi:hypothetical protein